MEWIAIHWIPLLSIPIHSIPFQWIGMDSIGLVSNPFIASGAPVVGGGLQSERARSVRRACANPFPERVFRPAGGRQTTDQRPLAYIRSPRDKWSYRASFTALKRTPTLAAKARTARSRPGAPAAIQNCTAVSSPTAEHKPQQPSTRPPDPTQSAPPAGCSKPGALPVLS